MRLNRRDFSLGMATGFVAGGSLCYLFSGAVTDTLDITSLIKIVAIESEMFGIEQSDWIEPFSSNELDQAVARLADAMQLQQMDKLTASAFRDVFRKQVRAEVEEGRVISVSGRILSKIEYDFLRIVKTLHSKANDASVNSKVQPIATGLKFGPKKTVVGQIFNEQPDGHGGIWVASDTPVAATVNITVDGVPIKTTNRGKVITGAVYDEMLAQAIEAVGSIAIGLVDTASGVSMDVGMLRIAERPPALKLENGSDSVVFCEPESIVLLQKDGKTLAEIKTQCWPRTAVVIVDGNEYSAKFNGASVLADISAYHGAEISEILLFDPASGDRVTLPVD